MNFLNEIFFEWSFETFLSKIFKCNFLNERSHIKMSQYFPKPFKSFGANLNVTVDLSNYATKTDLKIVTHVDTSSFAKKQI